MNFTQLPIIVSPNNLESVTTLIRSDLIHRATEALKLLCCVGISTNTGKQRKYLADRSNPPITYLVDNTPYLLLADHFFDAPRAQQVYRLVMEFERAAAYDSPEWKAFMDICKPLYVRLVKKFDPRLADYVWHLLIAPVDVFCTKKVYVRFREITEKILIHSLAKEEDERGKLEETYHDNTHILFLQWVTHAYHWGNQSWLSTIRDHLAKACEERKNTILCFLRSQSRDDPTKNALIVAAQALMIDKSPQEYLVRAEQFLEDLSVISTY